MKLDFNKTVYLQIGGEIGKNNSLPLKYFAELSKNLQSLVDTLVEFELPEDEGIDRKNFQLELTDFKENDSAIPGFSFTKDVQSVIGGDALKQRDQISESFEKLIKVANKGTYQQLEDFFPNPDQRKKVTKSLYGFVNSLKTPKVAFGNFDAKKGFKSDFSVKKFKREVCDQLLEVEKVVHEIDTEYVYGRIKLTTQNGKERKAIAEIFESGPTKLSYVFEKIQTNNQVFNLTAPLYCSIEKSENEFLIESEMLNLSAKGITEEEAVQQFSKAFQEQFQLLQNTKYNDLSERQRVVKTFFTVLVKTETAVNA